MNRHLNARGLKVAQHLDDHRDDYRVAVSHLTSQARIIDAGIDTPGGLQAGLQLARLCMADLGQVSLHASSIAGCPLVQVTTDHPVMACLASQYAGWQVKVGSYFAMGSGPMRAAYAREELFKEIDYLELVHAAVGVLETKTPPSDDVALDIASKCNISPEHLTLVVAPTTSVAGSLQVVARSVETALHKLHTLGFPLDLIQYGFGTAPLPPIAKRTQQAIGLTNDAVLYGGDVTLWVKSDDDLLDSLGPKVPSSASSDYGAPFAEIFQRAGGDFYQIDPLLFSPARITFHNLTTGKVHCFGKLNEKILDRSFQSCA
ncbi:MAG TPA: methenyltetrahydromethanopterin cyclohydrolase [Gemmatales bacterium]|nr:methenyltetrahydromethanopterin cyclohydrolase [Gemmatales bacterium]